MPQFDYQATMPTGMMNSGTITATNRLMAIEMIRAMQLTPVALTEQQPRLRKGSSVPSAQLLNVYSGLADLLDSGVPLLKALELVASQTAHPELKRTLQAVNASVADGKSFAGALRNHPDVFGPLEVGLVAVGEEGGFLQSSLERVAEMKERQDQLRARLMNSLAYPSFLMLMGLVVTVGMFWFFVPIFEPMFERLRAAGELPLVTQWVLASSAWTKSWGLVLVILAAVAGAALIEWTRTAGAERWDRIKLQCRGVGPIVRDLTLSQFFHLFGMLLGNGVPLLRALDLAGDAMNNRFLKSAVRAGHTNVMAGGSLAAAIAACSVVPADITAAVAIAEQSNRLDSVLLNLSKRLEQRAYKKLEVLTRLLEPILMTLIAGMIGLLIIALLLPIITSAGRFQ